MSVESIILGWWTQALPNDYLFTTSILLFALTILVFLRIPSNIGIMLLTVGLFAYMTHPLLSKVIAFAGANAFVFLAMFIMLIVMAYTLVIRGMG